MNDEVANRLLKTLEEPAPFVHLILLTDALGQVIPTVVSRCQLRALRPAARRRGSPQTLEGDGVEPSARARLRAAGAGQRRARALLASERGRGAAGRRRRDGGGARWPAGRRHDAEPGAGCSSAPRSAGPSRRGRGRRRRARAPRVRAQGPRPQRARAPVRGGRQARGPPRRSARCSTWASPWPRWRFRDLLCLAEGAPEAVLDPDRAGVLAARPAGATRAACARRPSAARTSGCR